MMSSTAAGLILLTGMPVLAAADGHGGAQLMHTSGIGAVGAAAAIVAALMVAAAAVVMPGIASVTGTVPLDAPTSPESKSAEVAPAPLPEVVATPATRVADDQPPTPAIRPIPGSTNDNRPRMREPEAQASATPGATGCSPLGRRSSREEYALESEERLLRALGYDGSLLSSLGEEDSEDIAMISEEEKAAFRRSNASGDSPPVRYKDLHHQPLSEIVTRWQSGGNVSPNASPSSQNLSPSLQNVPPLPSSSSSSSSNAVPACAKPARSQAELSPCTPSGSSRAKGQAAKRGSAGAGAKRGKAQKASSLSRMSVPAA